MSRTTDRNKSSHPPYQRLPDREQNGNGITLEGAIDDTDVAIDDDHSEHAQCGLGSLRCRCLQVFAHPNAFALQIGLLYIGVYGCSAIYLPAVISTVEKRFQLKSSESGLLMSMNDISALCVVIFVAHFGGKYHRPRIIGMSGLLVGIGSFMTALPQFMFDNPSVEGIVVSNGNQSGLTTGGYETDFTCHARENATVCTAEEIQESGSQLGKTWPLILGQLLCGIGTTALSPLSVTYIDDAVEKTLLPVYLALMWLPMTFGPLIGFSLSSYCLSVFIDFYKTDATKLDISPLDPQWQGAWWMGFIIYGCYLCLVSIPFLFFPKVMDKPKSYFCFSGMPDCCKGLMGRGRGGQGAGDVAMAGVVSHETFSGKPVVVVKDFLASLWRLLSNRTYLSTVAGFSAWVLCFGGFGVFSAKYIQFEFGTSPSQAGLLLGFTNMPGTLVGLVLGAILTSRLSGDQRGYAVLSIAFHVLSTLIFVIMMFLGCPNIDIAGLTTQYRINGQEASNGLDVYSTCNADCMCEKGVYSPVCGSDNVTYITACFAGCEGLAIDEHNKTIFQECSCILSAYNRSLDEAIPSVAIPGACASYCGLLLPYIILVGVGTASGSLSYSPTFMMQFRSVLENDRHLALGLVSFLTKMIGFIPAPVIFGAVIESQCSYWQESCHETGECMLYDRPGLRLAYLGLTTVFKFLSLLCFSVGAYFVFKTIHEPDIDDEAKEMDQDKREQGEMKNKEISHKETAV